MWPRFPRARFWTTFIYDVSRAHGWCHTCLAAVELQDPIPDHADLVCVDAQAAFSIRKVAAPCVGRDPVAIGSRKQKPASTPLFVVRMEVGAVKVLSSVLATSRLGRCRPMSAWLGRLLGNGGLLHTSSTGFDICRLARPHVLVMPHMVAVSH